jgi:hypothetical protein
MNYQVQYPELLKPQAVTKLEWLEPSLELLHDPESGPIISSIESTISGPIS